MLKPRTFYIETYGCTSNKADSAIISNVLKNSNYKEANIQDADFIIINTCAVKEQTENKIKARLKELEQLHKESIRKHIIIAGCLPRITPHYINKIKEIIPSFAAIIDLDNINEISNIIQEIEKGGINLIFTSDHSIDKSEFLIEFPKGKITGVLPISEGCLGSCTYCCVKNARGSLYCYDPNKIIKNAHHQLNQGIRQLYLTSQDCSNYNHNGTQLVEVVQEIVAHNEDFFLRIGMINPHFLIDNLDQLISIFKLEKVYQFLHIPIQSGSDKILKLMQRTYTISEILEPIDILRKMFPYLTISTDIICGFPGETEYDFYRTINLIKWLKPEILNISKFTARPGTKAKKMKQLGSNTIKERSIRLSNVFRNSLKTINEKWNAWKGKALVLHRGSEKCQDFGRNFAYKNIFIDKIKENYGVFKNVEIEKIDGFNLYGRVI